MRSPGKVVSDEFYIHLSCLADVQNKEITRAVERLTAAMPCCCGFVPNVAKVNLRSGRVSLLAYPDFFEAPFPELAVAWVYQPGSPLIATIRRYDDALNPPILHRKELLVSDTHPDYERWLALTKVAESLGLFDDTSTIGFRLNWRRHIESKGYQLSGNEFVPLGNNLSAIDELGLSNSTLPVQRHLTALSRTALSAPVQLLIRHGLLSPSHTFFDYGCGRGGDVAALSAEGYDANGWDPHFAPTAPRVTADIVNLGFVVNVIEDPAERVEAINRAFRLARSALAVGVMLYGNDTPGRPFRDGFLTSRNTFQKYFSQSEIKDYLEQVLHRPAFMVAPGVAFVFTTPESEQSFSASRYRSTGLATRLLAARSPRVTQVRERKPQREPKKLTEPSPPRQQRPTPAQLRLAAIRPSLDRLWALCLDMGRFPEAEEVSEFAELLQHAGSLGRAQRMLTDNYDMSLLAAAARARADDVRLFMATQQFAKRPPYRQLEPRLQRDIRAFFGDYKAAQEAGLRLLSDAADPANVLAACRDAATRGLGWLHGEHSLQLHVSIVERLPTLLRAYVACGLNLWDSLSEVQLVKIHIVSGKLTLMEYDSFDESPLPLLRRRIKVQIRRLDYDVFEYGSPQHPKPALYFKSRYLNEDFPGYAEQLVFDEALERLGIGEYGDHAPPPDRLAEILESRRIGIDGMRLLRSKSIPDLDAACGANFTFRDFVECGETQKRVGIRNVPRRPETYNAIYDLATQILDPLIDYFGAIRLTYGFASPNLTKYIAGGIAPKLDQHASCEHSSRGTAICDRGGAACDLIVDDEDMREVADWIIANLPFDRLYYYGSDRPLHVSHSPNSTGEAFAMIMSASGRLMPRPFSAHSAN